MYSAFLITVLVFVAAILWGALRTRNLLRDRYKLLEEYHALREDARLLRFVSKNSSDGTALLNTRGRIVWANEAYIRLTGYRLGEMIGRIPLELWRTQGPNPPMEEIESYPFDDQPEIFDRLIIKECCKKNGEKFYSQIYLTRAQNEDIGGRQLIVMTSRDVSQQVKRDQELTAAHQKLLTSARTDDLTGLASRKWFSQCIEDALSSSNKSGEPLALMLIDLDRFKEINDTHGHAAGDAMLCHVAELLEKSVGEDDMISRLGGDEFAILIKQAPSLEVLTDLARKFGRKIRAPLTYETAVLSVSTTIGIARSEPGVSTESSLTRQADFALYFAKNERRGNVSAFDLKLRAKYDEQRLLKADLADALSSQDLEFAFQPVVDVSTGRVKAFETLCRWTHPQKGPVSPGVFLPMVKEMRRTADLDMVAASAALDLLGELEAKGHDDIAVNINVSPETLVLPTFSDFISWETERLDLSNDRVQLEILEDTFFASEIANDLASEHVARLRKLGFNVLLDDFGAGFAGLTHLATLDVSGIKIDRSLVSPLTEDRQTRIILQSVAELCWKLGLSVTAEGVETLAQAEGLSALGCPVQQGFYYAKPMPRDQVLGWLANTGDLANRPLVSLALP